MNQLLLPVTALMLSTVLCAFVDQVSPCQIQSFFARVYGSGEGNLLRVHLNDSGVPINATFTSSCNSATLKFTKFTEERRAINGSVVGSFRWAVNHRYVLAVKQGALVMEFAPKATFSRNHWFILKSCNECYAGLNSLETLSTPHMYVQCDSSGLPFLAAVPGRMAWFEIMNSACSQL